MAVAVFALGLTTLLPATTGAAEGRPTVTKLQPAVGTVLGGTLVRISGTGFQGATRVRFGITDAPWFQVDADTQITAESPAGAAGQSVHVTVTTATSSLNGPDDQFTYVEGAGWAPTDPIPYPHDSHTATLLRTGKVLVAGGNVGPRAPDDPSAVQSVALYDPAAANDSGGRGSWESAADTPPRLAHTATLLPDGRVLVAGGTLAQGGALPVAAELYNPVTDTWSAAASMVVPRRSHTATLLPGGRVLVAGGIDATGNVVSSAEVYTGGGPGEAGTWTRIEAMGATTFDDGESAADSTQYRTASDRFTSADTAKEVSGTHIRPGSRITRVIDTRTVELSASATGTGSGLRFGVHAGRYQHSATPLPGGRVLVAGGLDAFEEPLASAEVYDPAAPALVPEDGSGAWVPTDPMGTPRVGHSATLLGNGKVLVAGGQRPGALLASAEVYDTGTATWKPAGAMARARTAHTATALPGGRVLVAGGQGEGGALLDSAEVYDAAGLGTWAPSDSMSVARVRHSATALPDGKVLVVGGTGPSSTGPLSSAEVYDPSSTRPPPMLSGVGPAGGPTSGSIVTITGRFFTGATAVRFGDASAQSFTVVSDRRITAVSPAHGLGAAQVTVSTPAGTSVTSLASQFTYGAGAWSPAPTPPCAAAPCGYGQTATTLADGTVLMTRGDGSAQVYDPNAGGWRPTGTMTAQRASEIWRSGRQIQYSATRLQDGRVLVVGGCCERPLNLGPPYAANAAASAEIYDSAGGMDGSGAWTATAPMATARMGHTATLLPDGRVLVVGGTGDNDTAHVLGSAEIYDPGTGKWHDAGTMASPRLYATATVVDDGTVLVAGGFGHSSPEACDPMFLPLEVKCPEAPQASAELYTPRPAGSGGSWVRTADLHHPRAFHSATALPGGRVLLAGGSSERRAELYDPVDAKWSETAAMNAVRNSHSATLLPSGKVLMAGGWTSSSEESPSADLFDPATGRWIAATAMGTGRYLHSAALVGSGSVDCRGAPRVSGPRVADYCGSVLVVGGFARADSRPIVTAESYTPAPEVTAIEPDRGPSAGGTEVMITGSGFAGVTSVRFGELPATFRIDSPARITASSPAHAPGTAVVDVSGPGGTSSLVDPSAVRRFAYVLSATPPTTEEEAETAPTATSKQALPGTVPAALGAAPPAVGLGAQVAGGPAPPSPSTATALIPERAVPARTETRHVVPRWLVALTAVSLAVNLALLGVYINRRYRSR